MPNITVRTIKTAQPAPSAYFIRDRNLKGFALRVFPSGTIKYIAGVWYNGKWGVKLEQRFSKQHFPKENVYATNNEAIS